MRPSENLRVSGPCTHGAASKGTACSVDSINVQLRCVARFDALALRVQAGFASPGGQGPLLARPRTPFVTPVAVLFVAVVGTLAPRAYADDGALERYARLALDCVEREYPNKIAHVLNSDADARPPRALTPAFYGCLDWHSAVHAHWMLARFARARPHSAIAPLARTALARSLTPTRIAGEVAYLDGPGRTSFERPYGLAWLLQLAAELREWDDPDAQAWTRALAPLESLAADRLRHWLPRLTYPIRSGEHSQSAFALGLAFDWARTRGDTRLEELIRGRAQAHHAGDQGCPLAWEPSGQDFLSPCLAEADLMRRVLPAGEFAAWLSAFLPGLPVAAQPDWLPPARVSDRSDPKLAHLDGLNLSRAWMLEGIAAALPVADARRATLQAAASAHRDTALAAVTGEHYEGGHWLGTFALYLVTGRGLPGAHPGPSG